MNQKEPKRAPFLYINRLTSRPKNKNTDNEHQAHYDLTVITTRRLQPVSLLSSTLQIGALSPYAYSTMRLP